MLNMDLFQMIEIAINLSILDFKYGKDDSDNSNSSTINLSILDFKSF